MNQDVKSDLIVNLEEAIQNHNAAESPQLADMMILDGAAVVNMIAPGPARTFDEYAGKVLNYMRQQCISNFLVV